MVLSVTPPVPPEGVGSQFEREPCAAVVPPPLVDTAPPLTAPPPVVAGAVTAPPAPAPVATVLCVATGEAPVPAAPVVPPAFTAFDDESFDVVGTTAHAARATTMAATMRMDMRSPAFPRR